MTLYDADFFAWTQDQAGRLRRLAAERNNVDLDLENLAEEIESMGKEQKHAVQSGLSTVIEHLLKLEHSPASDPRRGWRISVLKARDEIAVRLEDNPALRASNVLGDLVTRAWKHGRKRAWGAMIEYGEAEAAKAIPVDCPYSADQLRDDSWWPVNRHGIAE